MIIFAAAFAVMMLLGLNSPSANAKLQLVAINGENRPLDTGDPVQLRNNQSKFKDSRKITHHFRGIQRMHLKFI
jgi:hypothetical protein